MTHDINWSNSELGHVKSIFLFKVSDDDELKKTFN